MGTEATTITLNWVRWTRTHGFSLFHAVWPDGEKAVCGLSLPVDVVSSRGTPFRRRTCWKCRKYAKALRPEGGTEG